MQDCKNNAIYVFRLKFTELKIGCMCLHVWRERERERERVSERDNFERK